MEMDGMYIYIYFAFILCFNANIVYTCTNESSSDNITYEFKKWMNAIEKINFPMKWKYTFLFVSTTYEKTMQVERKK